MTTLEKIRAEIFEKSVLMHFDGNYYIKVATVTMDTETNKAMVMDSDVLNIIAKYAEQEPTDEWQDGYDRAWEEAEVFYEKEEPTIPCDLCGFNTDDVCEYLSVCPATGRAVSK